MSTTMLLAYSLLVALAAAASGLSPVPATAAADLVTSLPGLGSLGNGYRQYSGYLDGGEGVRLHYWFIESQNDPANDPLLLWLNGGPGCSSLDGLLSELGPFTVNEDLTLKNNPYSWNTFANIVYLEAPVCVGFSYNTGTQSCVSSDNSTAQHNYNALKHFFVKFPSYLSNPFFVTGESYGGIYVPTLSVKIVENHLSLPLNFQGFAVGNGMTNYNMNDDSLIFFANYHGLFGKTLWGDLVKHCCAGGVISETKCAFSQADSTLCYNAVSDAMQIVYNSGLNVYNLYGDCAPPSRGAFSRGASSKGAFSRGTSPAQAHLRNVFRGNARMRSLVRSDPPCTNYGKETSYLNSPAVRAALHIPETVQQWSLCSTIVGILYQRQYSDMAPQYKALSQAGVRGLVYNGDTDMACNFIGDQWFVDGLGYTVTEEHRPWVSGGQVGGFVKRFRLLDLLTVRGSGHMVPEDRPMPALDMITAFVFNRGY